QRGDSGRGQAAVLRRAGRRGSTGIVEVLNREEWRIETHAGIRIGTRLTAAVKNSITRADYHFACGLVGEANARREIIQIGGDQARTGRRAQRDNAGQCGCQLHIKPLGTTMLSVARSKVPCWLNLSLTVVKIS